MVRLAPIVLCLVLVSTSLSQNAKKTPSFDYEVARSHEIKPHRRTVPLKGVTNGWTQLSLNLTISPTGDVVDARANGQDEATKHWPELQSEVYQWKFTPFEQNGVPVQVDVEEYIDLVPPERFPKVHVPAPPLHPDSKISISLERTGCLGSCPGYQVTVDNGGIRFHGGYFVVAVGDHTAAMDKEAITKLAQHFLAADFLSMEPEYVAGVTDMPTYILQFEIDGNKNKVVDYSGTWVGMPELISELEQEVDDTAGTNRWISGTLGLVPALKAENYNFKSFAAQIVLKEAASRGESTTVLDLLDSGVPLKLLPAPKPTEKYQTVPFEHVGWLNAASRYPDALKTFIDAGASKTDQADKDLALSNAANSGSLSSVRLLLAYGANPNANLSKLVQTQGMSGMTVTGQGDGSVLISAASSGKPDLLMEILKYHPKLEERDRLGRTALITLSDWRSSDEDGDRAECVRLLVAAGANVNARDRDGNTPLHETYLGEVEKELLRLGADINARNNEGDTPIATTVDQNAYLLYLDHGADLTIRNHEGKTMMEVIEANGPAYKDAFLSALETKKLEHGKNR